jgi:DNA-binding response OmpR family regulator
MKKQIFAIDDEIDIQEIVKINLSGEGYDVLTFSSAEEALAGIKNSAPDLIILDIMMQGIDGYEFCRQLRGNREYRNIPIIFLSAKSEEFDKVLGLELGGDDYITKPFSIKELKSRVKAILRRTTTTAPPRETDIIRYKGIELNSESFSLTVDGEDVPLTKTEFSILSLFLANPGKIFSRDNIIDSTRGTDVYVIDRTIDVHIMNLRKKLGKYKEIIKTFSGVGYGFREIK